MLGIRIQEEIRIVILCFIHENKLFARTLIFVYAVLVQDQLCVEYPVAEEISGAIWRSLLMTGATLGLVATILTVTS